ncbi:MAG: nitric oxide synthase [Gemmatimonadales bacterium]|nr:MAG: nitric oxide synthase [Gemmatimonadales bacterium]
MDTSLSCPSSRRRLPSPSVSTLLDRAAEFLELCAAELGQPVSPARLEQIRREVESRGTYTHTGEELRTGGKLAWRNSTRCIGRLHWQSLEIRDHRHLHRPDAIFQALVEHLRFATNGGKIRSTLSIFPPADPATGEAPRIWNGKLVRYAGYDGGPGDPEEAEFTQRCLELGWKPPGGRPGSFDLLPVLIQGAGEEEPHWFELPGDEVLEVEIRHPRLAFLEEMAVRWYAVPVITDMILEMGGIEYPCAPFNGWFMGTEIGARNLADADRYDLLPRVARGLGLDPEDRRTLWRDRALLELNEAVLHSFREDGVTVVDHHTASRQWDTFVNRESRAGRPVHGDWSWLVPPMSGSTSSVFHSELENKVVSPNFYYRDPPWQEGGTAAAENSGEEPGSCPFHIRSRRRVPRGAYPQKVK